MCSTTYLCPRRLPPLCNRFADPRTTYYHSPTRHAAMFRTNVAFRPMPDVPLPLHMGISMCMFTHVCLCASVHTCISTTGNADSRVHYLRAHPGRQRRRHHRRAKGSTHTCNIAQQSSVYPTAHPEAGRSIMLYPNNVHCVRHRLTSSATQAAPAFSLRCVR